MKRAPHVVVIAGPNGSGKTSLAPSLLRGALGVDEFVNTDAIALGLSAFRPERATLAAGKVMLRRLRELAGERADFAFESTLAGRTYAPWLASLGRSGYHVHILYLWLSSPELAVARVAARVRLGGHDVPEEDIRRRYRTGLRSLGPHRSQSLRARSAERCETGGPSSIAVLTKGSKTTDVHDRVRWERIRRDGESGEA